MDQGSWRAACSRALTEVKGMTLFQYNALPVGGFLEAAKLLQRIKRTLPNRTVVGAVLDGDAFDNKLPIL